ncbi:DHA2 family efflux MFS transporter permease subunit [bacterium]|nr:DHA2 family efflux MFS transporter permease subunit [bacterium]
MAFVTLTTPSLTRVVPLIVAVALLMENIDSSVLATSLPEMARDLASDPIHLKLVLTSYLLALAVFIPASGWAADRFGARTVFRAAIAVFAFGSIACGMSQNLWELVIARTLQGIGGSMMVPVGRLIVLRSVPRDGLVGALAWLTVPALLGPVMGPPLGGFITTYYHWRWIFWINIPLAVLGIVLATILIPNIREEVVSRFDGKGFFLAGPGLAAFLTGVTLAGLNLAPLWLVVLLIGGGLALTTAFVFHALKVDQPLVDLRLLTLPTFRVSVTAGTLFRIGVGALPFLLPLMFQFGFGLSAFRSGMLTFVSGMGAMMMKFAAQPLLRRFGFRGVLTGNAFIAAVFLAGPALFTPSTPSVVILGVLLVGGLTRSLQFTAVNAIAYAEVSSARLSSATSFTAVLQQLSGSVGITIAAMALELTGALRGTSATDLGNFPYVFGIVTLMALSSALLFARLSPSAGVTLVQRKATR